MTVKEDVAMFFDSFHKIITYFSGLTRP